MNLSIIWSKLYIIRSQKTTYVCYSENYHNLKVQQAQEQWEWVNNIVGDTKGVKAFHGCIVCFLS